MARERLKQPAIAPLEGLERPRVIAPGAIDLGGQRLMPPRTHARGVLLMGAAANLSDERRKTLPDAGCLELVAQHRRERQRQRRAGVEQVQERQVGARDRLPEPLLTEGPGTEALDVGHVCVQNDRQRAARSAHGRHTARKSSARSRSASPARRRRKSEDAIAGVKRS